jgi:putative serine/threonine protein kinase
LIPETRYTLILNYPASGEEAVAARLRELEATGVTAIRFVGPSMIDGLEVLGKGCVGIVTQAVLEDRLVALKIRRSDADRPSMYDEAWLLRLANSVNVGPRLLTATKNFLVMELFDGVPLFRWAVNQGRRRAVIREVLSSLLDACFRLDSIGLDHGELSRAPKNVLVGDGGETCVVDFESASAVRRVANVTSLLQYFLFGSISHSLSTSKMFPRRRKILMALSEYKQDGSLESYRKIREVLRL